MKQFSIKWNDAIRYAWVSILTVPVTFVLDSLSTILLGAPFIFAENIMFRTILFAIAASMLPLLYNLFLLGFNFAAKTSPNAERGYNIVGTIYLGLAIYQFSIIIKNNTGLELLLFAAGRVLIFILALIAITQLTVRAKSKSTIPARDDL